MFPHWCRDLWRVLQRLWNLILRHVGRVMGGGILVMLRVPDVAVVMHGRDFVHRMVVPDGRVPVRFNRVGTRVVIVNARPVL